ncbi:kinase-like domain-containing protein [Halteromyces radiatus]|uniref:kinase-like domain-containing protein n=1 Tax=Halteromyces radiatus TaxID=101107 RepID=UPI00221FF25C|nr:kinase-like domain-containing protein [Halteromyces radiatus]KAI8084496.1 kinase-like domain-containing protein [Halteromyces radiatus]
MAKHNRHVYDRHNDNVIVGLDHQLGEKIGQGSFGIIYEGTNLTTKEPVAIKFETCDAQVPQLKLEYEIYQVMNGLQGIPRTYYFGIEGIDYCMVMDLLGPSLEELFEMCGRQFSLKTVVGVGKDMVSLLQSVHERHYIFRDVKPDNFLISHPKDKSNILHLIDFGMAKRYWDPKTQRHIPFKEKKALSGTARYMSINTHLGREQSRRDDLESLCHVLLYFLRGSLPWQGIQAANSKLKYERICKVKQETNPSDLCDNYPDELATLLTYARSLRFDESPDYDYCRELLDNALASMDEIDDGIRDWMLLNDGKGWEVTGRKKPKKPLLLMPN